MGPIEIKKCRLNEGKTRQVCVPDEKDRENTPNYNEIGKGYNMLLSEPLEHGDRDPGFGPKLTIFHPYHFNDDCKCVESTGYLFTRTKDCDLISQTVVFENSNDIKKELEQVLSFKESIKSIDITFSEGEDAQFTNSVAFGEEVSFRNEEESSSSSNNCIDESSAKETTDGKIVKTNEQKTWGTDVSIDPYAEAKAGFNFGIASGEVKAGVKYHWGAFYESTWGEDTETSHEAKKAHSIKTKVCDKESKTSKKTKGTTEKKETETKDTTGTQRTETYKVPGYIDEINNTKTAINLGEMVRKYSQTIGITKEICKIYEATLEVEKPPPFTSNFIDQLRKATKF